MRQVFRAVSLAFLLTGAGIASPQASNQASIDTAWNVLNTGLEDNNKEIRARATRILGDLDGNPKAEKAALDALKNDKEPEVRAAGAQALGEMGAKDTTTDLNDAFQDPDPSVIIAAAHSLIQLGDNRGYNVYYAILTGEQKTGTSLTEQQKKLLHDPKKLAAIGGEAAIGFIPFGSVALSGYKLLKRDDTSPVLAAAALMLAKDPDPKSGDALANASADQEKWLVRAAAFQALAKREDPGLIGAAEAGLQDSKAEVRITAAAAVIHLHDVGSRPQPAPKPEKKPTRKPRKY
ncbi:MAG: HEAT repeat domain-containing protein [Silvibacterium sp.]|nr:HEAT repeat domain-containing protein [Silvibacterium sp.]MBV8436190.1 HEAT repeat domain-containing protein [Silvibacterium sp.]